MKIGAISDLHIKHEESSEFIATLIAVCKANKLDLLLIAGDISEDVNLTIDYINKINKSIECLYVPGNHDLWNRYNNLTTEQIYELYDSHKHCLLAKSKSITSKVDVVGHIGWYDYSLGDNQLYSNAELDSMTIEGRTWQDKNYISWTSNNCSVATEIDDQIESLLANNQKQKILITHMISNPGFKVIIDEHRQNKAFFNSYLGTERLYQMTKDNNISHAICGHVHYRKTIVENQVKYICSCLGGSSEWSRYSTDTSLRHQLTEAMYILKI